MTEQQKNHTAMVHRRQSLLKMQAQENSRLLHTTDKEARKFLNQMLRNIENQLKRVDIRLAEILKELAKVDPNVEILRSHAGVGVVTISVLLTQLSDLKTLGDQVWENGGEDVLRSIVVPNQTTINHSELHRLGELVDPGDGDEIVEMLQLAIQDKPFPI